MAQAARSAAGRRAGSARRHRMAPPGRRQTPDRHRRGGSGQCAGGGGARRGNEAARVLDDAAGRPRDRAPIAAAGGARDRSNREGDVPGVVREGARPLPHGLPDAVRRWRVRRAARNEDEPLESEIEIHAAPRGKRTQRIHLLSSGERTLVAVSLLFAIFLAKPSPFCLLDEVDAPLDDANVGCYVRLLAEFKDQTQFIVITHNPRTMQAADAVYGVTMQEPGVSTIVGVRLGQMEPV